MFALHKCWTKVKSRDYCGVEPHQMYNCIACKKFSLFKTVQVHLELRVSPCEDLLVCTVRREYANHDQQQMAPQGHFRKRLRLLTSFPGLPHLQFLIVFGTVSRGGEGLGTRVYQGLIEPSCSHGCTFADPDVKLLTLFSHGCKPTSGIG